ncbi:hypothetical protein C0Q70_09278 [Pomacea canaliculata]|uniref:Uncharacterized protein n=2 Tax=Pomacea canaliculata TaxID=400727 RepID=A0A2T7P9B3_POMCA|nr:hypothetical protein C0Q70_09278 [Pomacea canaliculata]
MRTVPRYNGNEDLSGKTCVVTGANAGIGFTTALEFAKRNARVILACRNKERAEEARDKIIQKTGNSNVVFQELDLTRIKSVRKFVERIIQEEERLDILVNNAGVIGLPNKTTEDGLEPNFATNHFGPFLLTNLLLELLKKSAPARVINVSSTVQSFGKIEFDNLRAEKSFSAGRIYFNSKLANVLFTRELAKRLKGTGVVAVCLHPGSVQTDLLANMPFFIQIPMRLFRIFLRTQEEGAQTTLYCALASEVKDMSGKYFAECELAEDKVNPLANDPDICQKLWELSSQYTGLQE